MGNVEDIFISIFLKDNWLFKQTKRMQQDLKDNVGVKCKITIAQTPKGQKYSNIHVLHVKRHKHSLRKCCGKLELYATNPKTATNITKQS